ncbi:MAG: deoxyribonuclease IV [Candidatus Heimdallarchaeota archaeon]|nr:deoxyribonuclease IV [Candidatus Heimdallarchaeota archaeon]MDH5647533.1 deoxyribonuclease IV [Candidatus Heimdallarchaeota archaeon]
MPLIGYHTSIQGGYSKASERAKELDLDTYQLFLSSPKIWNYPELTTDAIKLFKDENNKNQFPNTTIHMGYLVNPSSGDLQIQSKSQKAFLTEITYADKLGVTNIVIHIGSHKGLGFDFALNNIKDILNQAIELKPNVNLLLETASGFKNSVGSSFEELDFILSSVDYHDKIGICFDTCHVFAAGYDISSELEVLKTLRQFDDIVGLDRIRAIHLNDSKEKLGKGKDLHEHIGLGNIGEEGFKTLLNYDKFKKLPFILETPSNQIRNTKENISFVRSLLQN